MPIYKIQNKLILFIHIPKSGGTSLKSWLGKHATESFYMKHRKQNLPVVPQHFHRELLDGLFSPGFFDYSFCITRNPYARTLSEYNYRITRPQLRRKLLPKPPFDLWLRMNFNRYERNAFHFSNHLRPQNEFPIEGTDVFRLEDGLTQVQERLQDITGLAFDADIPRQNISKKTASRITEAQAKRIHTFYEKDFEKFGYDADSWRDI